jgi:hypothetical protein
MRQNFAYFKGRINPCHALHYDIADEHVELVSSNEEINESIRPLLKLSHEHIMRS